MSGRAKRSSATTQRSVSASAGMRRGDSLELRGGGRSHGVRAPASPRCSSITVGGDEGPRPRTVAACTAYAGVRHVIIGGFAVNAHGVIRPSIDLDIVPGPDPANVARLAALLSEIDATRRTGAQPHRGRSSGGGVSGHARRPGEGRLTRLAKGALPGLAADVGEHFSTTSRRPFGRGRLREARFARRARRPTPTTTRRRRRSARACGPSYETARTSTTDIEGAGSRGAPPAPVHRPRGVTGRSERQLRAWSGPRVHGTDRQRTPVDRCSGSAWRPRLAPGQENRFDVQRIQPRSIAAHRRTEDRVPHRQDTRLDAPPIPRPRSPCPRPAYTPLPMTRRGGPSSVRLGGDDHWRLPCAADC